MAWSLPVQRPPPQTYQILTPTSSSPQAHPQDPILSRCEMCNSSAPGGEKGATPAPILGRGWGQAWGPAEGKASWKEALVRHGAGGAGRPAPKCSSCLVHMVRRAPYEVGKAGPGGSTGPPGPSWFPKGQMRPHALEGALNPL